MRKMRPQISHICVVMAIPFQCTKFHRWKPNTPPAFQRGGKSGFGQRDANAAIVLCHRIKPKMCQTCMHPRDTYAETFSVGPRPGHANYPPVTRIDHISRLAAMGIWLHRACRCGARAGPSHMVNLVKSRSTFKRLGSDTCLYWRAVVTLPFLLGKW